MPIAANCVWESSNDIACHLTGLRLNISYTTDLLQATVLSYRDSYVDVYSNSWGPMETGFTVGHPGYFTLHTFQTQAAQVSIYSVQNL